jgi:hypothetical protein
VVYPAARSVLRRPAIFAYAAHIVNPKTKTAAYAALIPQTRAAGSRTAEKIGRDTKAAKVPPDDANANRAQLRAERPGRRDGGELGVA